MICKYHEKQGGTYDYALDISAGPGIVTEELLHRFKHVTLSDLSVEYIAQARSDFGSASDGRVTFLQAAAKDLTLKGIFNGEPVDMLASGKAIHWTEMDIIATKMSSVVKPGGTFAAWVYGTTPVFPDDAKSADIATALHAAYGKIFEAYESTIQSQANQQGAGPGINSRLNSVRFDPCLWQDVNTSRWGRTPSAVQAGETVQVLVDDALISYEAGYAFLEGYFDNIMPLDMKRLAANELVPLKEMLGDAKILMKWPTNLALATRR